MKSKVTRPITKVPRVPRNTFAQAKTLEELYRIQKKHRTKLHPNKYRTAKDKELATKRFQLLGQLANARKEELNQQADESFFVERLYAFARTVKARFFVWYGWVWQKKANGTIHPVHRM
jgi:hypothetical protein